MRKPVDRSVYMPFVEATKARVRWFLTSRPAIALSKRDRRRAAADPALEWNAATHSYQRKRRVPPNDVEGDGG